MPRAHVVDVNLLYDRARCDALSRRPDLAKHSAATRMARADAVLWRVALVGLLWIGWLLRQRAARQLCFSVLVDVHARMCSVQSAIKCVCLKELLISSRLYVYTFPTSTLTMHASGARWPSAAIFPWAPSQKSRNTVFRQKISKSITDTIGSTEKSSSPT